MAEAATCPLCKGQENSCRFCERGYDLRVCRQCGLLFIHPYPWDASRRHATVRDFSFREIDIVDVQKHYASECLYFSRYFPLVAEECRGVQSILDIGCGTGRLLELLGTLPGLYREGIELNGARAEMAREHAGCAIRQVPAEEYQTDRTFDVIILFNLLSHIPSFDNLFAMLQRLLAPGGKVIFKTGEVSAQAEKHDLFDWGIPDHLHFCGLETMRYCCEQYGLRLLRHQRIPYADECFIPARWQSPGASPLRNVAKRLIAGTPFALPLLAQLYERRHGGKVFSSFFVLSR